LKEERDKDAVFHAELMEILELSEDVKAPPERPDCPINIFIRLGVGSRYIMKLFQVRYSIRLLWQHITFVSSEGEKRCIMNAQVHKS
jgi:hypothetical protein